MQRYVLFNTPPVDIRACLVGDEFGAANLPMLEMTIAPRKLKGGVATLFTLTLDIIVGELGV